MNIKIVQIYIRCNAKISVISLLSGVDRHLIFNGGDGVDAACGAHVVGPVVGHGLPVVVVVDGHDE
ncbi:hypothetical protein LguiA_011172 [Lonicera macranthoides]